MNYNNLLLPKYFLDTDGTVYRFCHHDFDLITHYLTEDLQIVSKIGQKTQALLYDPVLSGVTIHGKA